MIRYWEKGLTFGIRDSHHSQRWQAMPIYIVATLRYDETSTCPVFLVQRFPRIDDSPALVSHYSNIDPFNLHRHIGMYLRVTQSFSHAS